MLKQRVDEQLRYQLDNEFSLDRLAGDLIVSKVIQDFLFFYLSDNLKAPRESCQEFLIITIGSLLASFAISFGLLYIFKDYDGLLTGILFL